MAVEAHQSTDGGEIRSPDSRKLVFDLVQKQLSTQVENVKALDTKAGFVLGSASLLTGLSQSLTTLQTRPSIQAHPEWPTPLRAFIDGTVSFLPIAAILAYVIVVYAAYKAYSLRRYRQVPNPVDTARYLAMTVKDAEDKLIDSMTSAFTVNEQEISRKAHWTRLALILLGVEGGIITAMLLLHTILGAVPSK